jgi:hypothetical protein
MWRDPRNIVHVTGSRCDVGDDIESRVCVTAKICLALNSYFQNTMGILISDLIKNCSNAFV